MHETKKSISTSDSIDSKLLTQLIQNWHPDLYHIQNLRSTEKCLYDFQTVCPSVFFNLYGNSPFLTSTMYHSYLQGFIYSVTGFFVKANVGGNQGAWVHWLICGLPEVVRFTDYHSYGHSI